jgi:ribosomal protein S27E
MLLFTLFNGEGNMRDKAEAIQIKCPTCDHTQIIYIPKEEIPKCPKCDIRMIIGELLDEGKSY